MIQQLYRFLYRITPAYAGKSTRYVGSSAKRIGSPPPMRGKAIFLYGLHNVKRITPAYAGKSILIACIRTFWEDHPRLCGEKDTPTAESMSTRGSPPPMRGKVIYYYKYFSVAGITPAYAGKSRRQLPRSCTVQDHPRLCGEKAFKMLERSTKVGSPPPMRGKGKACTIYVPCTGSPPPMRGKVTA